MWGVFVITTLSVDLVEKSERFGQFLNRLRRDRVEVDIKRSLGVSVKQIKYTSYSGKVKLDKISREVGSQRTQILCDENIDFAVNSGYRRFNSMLFSVRLCTNMAINILDECKSSYKLRVGIYDTSAVACECLLSVLGYCSDVVAVTKNSKPYFYITDRALDELGATAIVTKNVSELETCDLVIAPTVVNEPIALRDNAIMLTVAKPTAQVSGRVYYKYNFRIPNGFADMKPSDLSEEYFCSALYTLGSQYQLGSLAPLTCSNETDSQTVGSICAMLNDSSVEETIA